MIKMNYEILDYIFFFYLYSIGGWVGESIYCSVLDRKLTNRGFLTGPMCPIYGTGALAMLLSLGWIRPFFNSIFNSFFGEIISFFLVVILGTLVCDIVEYLTSYIMEKLFHARWWDYSHRKFNLHGRICLHHSVFWAIGAVAFIYILDPFIRRNILKLFSDKVLINTLVVVTFIFIIDLIHAIFCAMPVRKIMDKLRYFSKNIKGLPDTFSDNWKELNDKFNSWKKELKAQIFSDKKKYKKVTKLYRHFKNNKYFYDHNKQMFEDVEKKFEELQHQIDDNEKN